MHINTNELNRIDTILRAIQTIASDEEKKSKKMIQSSISTFIPTQQETLITATQRLLLLCESNELLKCGASVDLIRDKFLLIISEKDPNRIYTTKVISEAIKTKISSNLEAHLSETIRILSIEPAFHSPQPSTINTTTNTNPTPPADTEALYTHQDKGNRGRGRGGRNRGGGRYERSYSPYGNRGSGQGRGRGRGRGGIGNGPGGYQF